MARAGLASCCAALAVALAACAHPPPASVTLEASSPAVDAPPGAAPGVAVRPAPFTPRTVWARRLGGPGTQTVDDVAVDGAGNVAIAGTFSDGADFGDGLLHAPPSGEDALFVALLDEGGHARWSRAFAGASQAERLRVAFDAEGDVLVTGGISGPAIDFGLGPLAPVGTWDVIVAKIDRSGQPLWASRFGGPDWQIATGIAVDAAGNVVVAGGFTGAAIDFGLGPLPGSGSANQFVVALDPGGRPLWNRSFAATGHVAGVAVDGRGDAVVAGHFFKTLDVGLGPLRSAGDSDVFVAKLDPGGQAVWSRRLGGGGADTASAIAVDAQGNVAVTGDNRGPLDLGPRVMPGPSAPGAYVAVLDPAGRVAWARGTGEWGVSSAVFDGAGNLFVHGVSHLAPDFRGGRAGGRLLPHNQVYAVAFSPAGALLWSHLLGPSPPGGAVFAAVDRRNDDLVVVAPVLTDVDVGTGLLPRSDRNVLVVKLQAGR